MIVCIFSDVSSGVPYVIQTPDISVREGDTLTINCCWTLEAQRFIVNWLKNGTILKILQLVNFSEALDKSSCLNLTLTNISQEDSGRYICRVLTELPSYTVLEGNGTVLTVRAKGSTETSEGEKPLSVKLQLSIEHPEKWSVNRWGQLRCQKQEKSGGRWWVYMTTVIFWSQYYILHSSFLPRDHRSTDVQLHPEVLALPRPHRHLFLHQQPGSQRSEKYTCHDGGRRDWTEERDSDCPRVIPIIINHAGSLPVAGG